MAAGHRRLRCQPLLSRLATFGVLEVRRRGSHVIVLKPDAPGLKKGPTYPFPCSKPTAEVSQHIIRAMLRHFGISEMDFWDF
jgi:predicted RNA binding protein YcfA (HicA-like mRNA interferase family)